MFARAINVIFVFFFALPLFAGVTAAPRRRPGNSGNGGNGGPTTTTTTTNNNKCNVGSLNCCNSVQDAKSTNFGDLLGPLSLLLGPVTGNVGITCSPISIGGLGGSSCNAQTVCCENNSFNGLIAIGCNAININVL